MSGPLVPDYGRSTLADLVPAIAAASGVSGWTDALGLPSAQRWVLLLVDGLGDMNLAAAAEHAPYLASLRGRTLTSAAPSTTATSVTCIGTGLPPGQHGIVGYSFRHPFAEGALNALAWEPELSGLDVQPRLTAFERLSGSGVQVSSVSPARFEGSGLTTAGLRGARFFGVADETDAEARLNFTTLGAAMGERSLVYHYERSLDACGHALGWQTPEWRATLGEIDAFALRMREALPDDVRLVITGDHGMIDSPNERWVIAEDVPGLCSDLTLLAGEARLVQLYAEPAHVDAVAARWRSVLSDRAWVVTRDEAIAAGWFGPVDARIAQRIGDVLVVMRDDWSVMTRSRPGEFSLVGMHGSLTEAEMHVPLLVD